jgi:hypothetical protein
MAEGKPGAPPRPKELIRSQIVRVVLTETENEQLERQRKARKKNRSEYIRWLIDKDAEALKEEGR